MRFLLLVWGILCCVFFLEEFGDWDTFSISDASFQIGCQEAPVRYAHAKNRVVAVLLKMAADLFGGFFKKKRLRRPGAEVQYCMSRHSSLSLCIFLMNLWKSWPGKERDSNSESNIEQSSYSLLSLAKQGLEGNGHVVHL